MFLKRLECSGSPYWGYPALCQACIVHRESRSLSTNSTPTEGGYHG
jgi:hypothetical protein